MFSCKRAQEKLIISSMLPSAVYLHMLPPWLSILGSTASRLYHGKQTCMLQVRAGAVAWPHPDKVTQDKAKAVNRKGFGWAGEDAYFHAQCRQAMTHTQRSLFPMGDLQASALWFCVSLTSRAPGPCIAFIAKRRHVVGQYTRYTACCEISNHRAHATPEVQPSVVFMQTNRHVRPGRSRWGVHVAGSGHRCWCSGSQALVCIADCG